MIFIPREKWLMYAGGAVALLIALGWFADHERSVEASKIAARNYQQLAVAKEAADKETKRLQGVADAADKQATKEATDFAAYRLSHPVGHVWVCQPTSSGIHSPSGFPEANSGNAGPGTGPEAGIDVSGGSETQAVDIGPELDTIVQSFARVSIELQRWQRQPVAQ